MSSSKPIKLPKLPIVSSQWLFEYLHLDNLVVLDASMSKVVGKPAILYDEFVAIDGAVKCCVETDFIDSSCLLPHGFPTAAQFTKSAQQLGINSDTIVVIYDNQGVYSSPRAWWIFTAMGHKQVYILDGGLPQWLENNLPTAAKYNDVLVKGNIKAQLQPTTLVTSADVIEAIDRQDSDIVDARSNERFIGVAQEPRVGVRRGHIPSSKNMPFTELFSGHGYKSGSELAQVFASHHIDLNKRLIFTCGSGITACIVIVAAMLAGAKQLSLYDGSWSEWGSNSRLPIE